MSTRIRLRGSGPPLRVIAGKVCTRERGPLPRAENSVRLPCAENSVRQSHMLSILPTSSPADVKMYISWSLHLRAKSATFDDETDHHEHNTNVRKKRTVVKIPDNTVLKFIQRVIFFPLFEVFLI